MYGPGPGWGFGLWHVGMFLGGLALTAGLIVVAVLLVRYLVVATRAAQLYVDAHSATPPSAAEAPPATPPAPPAPAATKPTPRPRTPKTPPAAL
jgi:hypothetical protein